MAGHVTKGPDPAGLAKARRLSKHAQLTPAAGPGIHAIAPEAMVAQMASVRLPRPARGLSDRLFARDAVEIWVGEDESDLLRLSVAAYTTRDEIDRLLAALARELDAEHRQDDE